MCNIQYTQSGNNRLLYWLVHFENLSASVPELIDHLARRLFVARNQGDAHLLQFVFLLYLF